MRLVIIITITAKCCRMLTMSRSLLEPINEFFQQEYKEHTSIIHLAKEAKPQGGQVALPS